MLLLHPLSSRCPLHRSPRALLEAARVSSRSKLKVVSEERAPLKGWREMTTKLREAPEAQRNHLQATVGICTLGDSTTVTNRNVSHPSDAMKEKHWKSMKTICQTEFCSFPRCFFCDGPLTETPHRTAGAGPSLASHSEVAITWSVALCQSPISSP